MYRCYDIEIPRLFIADIKDLEGGNMDPAIKPGFECFFSPYLDTEKFSMRKVVATLTQHDCSCVNVPTGISKTMEDAKPLNNAPFRREYIYSYHLKQVAERTKEATDVDLVFACEDIGADEGSITELFEWIYGEHHPFGTEIVASSTKAFRTPLGNVTVTGPEGPVPFKVTKLLNRHYPYGKMRTVNKVEDLYELSVELDALVDNAEYRVGCEGRQLRFHGSDERTECFTCVAEGLAFGIGVYDPSDDWDKHPFYDPSKFMGYYVDAGDGDPDPSPIRITPVPLHRDKVSKAILWVGWLKEWDGPREPWQDAEDLLDYYLT